MRLQAKLYITGVLLIGFTLLLSAIILWESTGVARFLTYLLAGSLAGLMRIRIPGLPATYSLAALYLLLAIAVCSFSEIVVIGVLSTLIQCVSWTDARPKILNLAFNLSAMTITLAVAYYPCHLLSTSAYHSLLPLGLAIASGLFYVTNTSLLTGFSALAEGESFSIVWDKWLMWSFGYHLLGSAVAIILSLDPVITDWRMPLSVLPFGFMIFYYYRAYKKREVGD